jgi:hypothetical protein
MTKVLLRDLPGGQEFCRRCTKAVAEMGLAFAHEPADRVFAHLQSRRASFEAELAEQIGAETAAAVVDVIIAAVMTRKGEIEAAGRRGIA